MLKTGSRQFVEQRLCLFQVGRQTETLPALFKVGLKKVTIE
jgi:hypothetical protein